jgi:hypothetical protein
VLGQPQSKKITHGLLWSAETWSGFLILWVHCHRQK